MYMKKILFIIPVLAIALTGYMSLKPIVNKEPTVAQEKNYKTYTNIRHGYSVQYPSNWFINTELAEEDFREESGDDYIGGSLIFSYKDLTGYDDSGIPPYLSFYVYKNSKETDIKKYASERGFNDQSIKPLTINGQEAIELVGASFNQPHTIIKGDDKLYIFTYSGFIIPEGSEVIYQQIINSFTLTK